MIHMIITSLTDAGLETAIMNIQHECVWYIVHGTHKHVCKYTCSYVIGTVLSYTNGFIDLPWVHKQTLVCTITHGHLWTRI